MPPVITEPKERFTDAELAGFLDHKSKTFLPATEWAAKLRKSEIKRMLAGAGISTSADTVKRPVDHLITDLKKNGSGDAKMCFEAMKVLAIKLPSLIKKSETADFRIDHRGFGFARITLISRRDKTTDKTVRVDNFVGTGNLKSVRLTDSLK